MQRIGLVVLCSLVSNAVWAQEPQPTCESVTTPAPPPPPIQPDCCAGRRAYNPLTLPGGWKLVHVDGTLMMERKKKTGIASVWVPGMLTWLGSWVGLIASSAFDDRPFAAVPLMGGFITGGIDLADNNFGKGFGYALGSALQLSGFVTFLVGVSSGTKIERVPLEIAPMAQRDGGGATVRIRF
jgi:hypothetical protein